jgi:hypothetical protein
VKYANILYHNGNTLVYLDGYLNMYGVIDRNMLRSFLNLLKYEHHRIEYQSVPEDLQFVSYPAFINEIRRNVFDHQRKYWSEFLGDTEST